MDNVPAEALRWISEIFLNHKTPFQISGGLAANIYGSPRELADIDVEILEKDFPEVLSDFSGYVVFGPERFRDKYWDIFLMTLNYHGQSIDISAADSTKIFNSVTGKWESVPADISKAEIKEVFGISVPVCSLQELITYKKKLRRDFDLEDIEFLSRSS